MTYEPRQHTHNDCEIHFVHAKDVCTLAFASFAAAAALPANPAELQRVERTLRLAQRVNAAFFAAGMAGAANVMFLMGHFSHGQSILLLLALAAAVIGLPMAPTTWLWKRRLQRIRNEIVEKFYAFGLRVDEKGVVMTNEPHPRIVHDPRRPVMVEPSAPALPAAA
jgi:hypothetical protein